ncbi:N-acetylmuramidase family protein [Pseudomonas nitroreducens]|uniref:N-acetylmuramidase family protein n=1 Tax=Pseudomonas nitroreducens TaxID=46680 RepID=UPI00244B0283|nr:N-acetylmuramidase family protein [Pseudomonas nitroreducens]MDG9854113.1 N-acetylmuramidase family protein [Pseudomonas nitroreducens]
MTILRHGDCGQDVRTLQNRLNDRLKAGLDTTGLFDDATEEAVRTFQRGAGLVDDGIVGPKTQASLTGVGTTLLLGAGNLAAAAQRLSLPLATVYAVNEVESAGAGFLANGKPKILFERHQMYRQLCTPRTPDDDAAELKRHADELVALSPSLVNPAPGGYAGGTAEHQRLAQARMIDDTAALESTSWGAFQIMGYHATRLGYESVQAFAAAMASGEPAQFDAFVRFIEADAALLKALKARKWADFAKLYNGTAYARNLYDVKLQRAYERYADSHKEVA